MFPWQQFAQPLLTLSRPLRRKASPAGQTGISQHAEAAGECHVRAPTTMEESQKRKQNVRPMRLRLEAFFAWLRSALVGKGPHLQRSSAACWSVGGR
jgi:hypothetical protein